MFYSEGGATFECASRTGICKGTFEIVSKEVLWSVRGSYQTIWGPPLPNVTRHSGWWPSTVTPSNDQALHQFRTLLLIWTLLPNWTFYQIARGFHKTFATDAACQQRTLTPQDTWSCLTLGLASVLMLRPISPELVFLTDFWVLNIPHYFCFCLIWRKMYSAGFDLTTSDSRGRCYHYCAMEDFRFSDTFFPIFRQPIFMINLNTEKTVSRQWKLLSCVPTIVNRRGVPIDYSIITKIKRRNCQNELARLSDALCPLTSSFVKVFWGYAKEVCKRCLRK